MAILSILQYPDPRLKKVASPVDRVDEGICSLVRDMAETLYNAPGIGLAATQVDVHKQIIVIDISPSRNQLNVFINPEIIESEGMLAVCIQHEMDHLKGKVFVEFLSRLKRTRVLARIRKRERMSG